MGGVVGIAEGFREGLSVGRNVGIREGRKLGVLLGETTDKKTSEQLNVNVGLKPSCEGWNKYKNIVAIVMVNHIIK